MNVKHFFKYESPLGPLIIESHGENLTKLSFDRGEHALLREERDYTEERDAVLEGTCNWLDTYFGGEAPGFLPPIRTTRSEERRVGKECRSRWSPYH